MIACCCACLNHEDQVDLSGRVGRLLRPAPAAAAAAHHVRAASRPSVARRREAGADVVRRQGRKRGQDLEAHLNANLDASREADNVETG